VGRWIARRRNAHAAMARQTAAGIPGSASVQWRGRSGYGRYGQRVGGLLWCSGLRSQLAGLGLRHIHAPHQSRQLRQNRIRRREGLGDDVPQGAALLQRHFAHERLVQASVIPEPLWTPSPERIARANLTPFIAYVRGLGAPAHDFESLYDWSIRDLEEFWCAV